MKRFQGIAAAPGYAIGPALHFRRPDVGARRHEITDTVAELKRFEGAQAVASEQVQRIKEKAERELAPEQAAIFQAQLLMLQDPELLRDVRTAIETEHVNAEWAVNAATTRYARALEIMDDAYFRARAPDVRDIGARLQAVLLGVEPSAGMLLTRPSVVVAQDLTPSDTILMEKELLLGFCTVDGSETSHTAILARGLGIPAAVGVPTGILDVPDGTPVALNGFSGDVLVDPPPDVVEDYAARKRELSRSADEALARCREPAITRDGQAVDVVANIGSVEGAEIAVERGAEGVGLLRTEFLYMERATLPTEEEQFEAYSRILEVFDAGPVVLRTSDIGGDKGLPYLGLPRETNPFLGLRGLRLALLHADALLKPQLRAALRAGVGHDLRIMFPMVTTADEVRRARLVLDECKAELRREGRAVTEGPQVGIMVEVPSAALTADHLAPEVDFFSIGTNDLTQYTLAADRTNPALAYLGSAFSPVVLRLIRLVIDVAHRHGKWVSVCGELAGEPLGIPVLLGMGLDEFSMNPHAIPMAKQILRALAVEECERLAQEVLELDTADEVRQHVQARFPSLGRL